MRSRFVLLLLVGAAVSSLANTDNEHGWKVGQEYQYLVRSRTLTALHTISDEYTGIIIKAILKVQCNSPGTLRAELVMPQYAQIHKELSEGWETGIPDQMLKYTDLPVSKEPFAIKMKHGVVRELIMDKNVPTWEVNIVKSIVSQLQADTQGENARRTRGIQVPREKNPYAMFRVMEDSVGGKCEVLYDITPLPDYVIQDHPELVPKPELKGNGEHIYIMKTKNYNRCEERVEYHFGISGDASWDSHRKNKDFMRKSSTSSIVISGDLKSFVIQSSVTRNQIMVKPRIMDKQESIVMNKMNLTLASISKVSTPIPAPKNPESTGDLVYTYNSPFSATQHRRPRRPSISPNSIESVDDTARMDSHQDSRDDLLNDEDRMLWQPKPKLDEAPENPLLPLFIGNKGKAVIMSDKIDIIKNVRRFIQEISDELEEPNTMPDQETLEKFTILSRLIGSMSFEQLQKVEGDLHSFWNEIGSDGKKQEKKETARSVFRDAVASAGTGPALLIIKNWVEKRKIETMEAATVVSRLSKTARMPTAEYIDTLFTLATNPMVQTQMYLNSSAILSFADLVYLAQVSDGSILNNYPVNSFGRPTSRHNDVVPRKYIPFMAEQLKRAIKDGDSPRIQTYIVALGAIGHPKILSVFEPYIEGKEHVSTFQRLLMVANLYRLAENKPSLVGPVLYKIYLNTWEAHQIRCAAVFMLMKMNPPLDMILRMAKFTNYDYSKHVNSAVKSSIENAVEDEDCEWKEHAKEAQQYLNPSYYDYYYSQSSIIDTRSDGKDLAFKIVLDYIGSDDSVIPSSWFLYLQPYYGNFVAPAEEFSFMVSSMKNLIELFDQKKMEKGENKETPVEKIAKMLNIQSDYPEQVEGLYFVGTKYRNHFFAFDNHTLERLQKVFMERIAFWNKGQRLSAVEMATYDIDWSYPTETGLPFVYSLRMPILHKLSTTKKDEDTEFRLAVASKIQGRVGFVTPFDQQRFVSGIDSKIQIFMPGRIGMKLNPTKAGMEVTINLRASTQDEKFRMLHSSTVPYITRYNCLSLRPLLLEKNTQILEKRDRGHLRIPPSSKTESFFVMELDTDEFSEKMRKWMDVSTDFVQFPLSLGRGEYEKLDFYMIPGNDLSKAITFKAVFESMNVNAPGEANDENWKVGSKAPTTAHATPDSSDRRSNFLREAAKGMNTANAYVLDMALEFPGMWRNRHILTVSLAESNAERKYRSLFYWHVDIPDHQGRSYEVCGNAQMKGTASPPFNFEKILSSDLTEEIRMHIKHGEKCSEGDEISVKGKFTQSDGYKEYMKNSEIAKKCRERTKSGIESLEVCEQAVNLASALNEMNITVTLDLTSLSGITDTALGMLKQKLSTSDSQIATYHVKSDEDEKSVTFYAVLSPDFKKMDGMVSVPTKTLSVVNVDLEELGLEDEEMEDLLNEEMLDCKGTCTIGPKEAMTFDGRIYPLKLGKCSHVLATTYPKRDEKDHEKLWQIPDDMKLSVIARETEDNKKEVTIVLGDNKVLLKPSGTQLKAVVNGEDVQCSQTQSYQRVVDDEVIFEIYELPGPAIELTSDKYELDVTYDGEQVQIKLPSEYQKSVLGLCGDFDGQPENDFVTPKNCILKKSEEFAATYALKDQCEGEVLKHAKMAEKSMCTKKTRRFSDVISDEEAGRSTTDSKDWGYHKKDTGKRCNSYRTKVITKDDKICFTMRPVPVCSDGCMATETKPKKYQLYCMPKNEAGLGMKERVEQGANPDLSQRTASATETISVPLECAAA